MGIYNENNKRHVQMAIKSILNQTFKNFEFIICDDGSEESNYLWLCSLCNADKRIKIIRNKNNRGLAAALNSCINASKGKYIARMDADDISLPQRLEKQYEFLERNKKIDLVGCEAYLVDDKGIWGCRRLLDKPEKIDFLFTSPFIHPTVMIRRAVYKKLMGYETDKRFSRVEDYDFFMRLYESGYKGYNLQEILFKYREDRFSYKKRKYRFRLNEVYVRYRGFKKLGLLPGGLIYTMKPLIAGMIPARLIRHIRKYQFNMEE